MDDAGCIPKVAPTTMTSLYSDKIVLRRIHSVAVNELLSNAKEWEATAKKLSK